MKMRFILQKRPFDGGRIVSVLIAITKLVVMASAIQRQAEQCPSMCICDRQMDFNTANCSDEHLISGNVGMSSYVELLDLSRNDITTIDNQCFDHLQQLNTLLLNRNSISFIELEAFSRLIKLERINLANNRLESFDNRIFEQNTCLMSVDLSHNKFMQLPNEPILKSASLQTLDLHKSQITHLHVKFFEELPSIQSIDLSENLFIVFDLVAFATNSRLHEINIQANRIKCDAQVQMSLVWLRRNGVNALFDKCLNKSQAIPKFERMQMLPSTKPQNDSPQSMHGSQANDLNDVWHTHNQRIPILNEQCTSSATQMDACHLFDMCVGNFSLLLKEVDKKLLLTKNFNDNVSHRSHINLINFHRNWSEFVTVNVAFYGGLFLGAVFGAIILFMMKITFDYITAPKMGPATRPDRSGKKCHQVPEIRSFQENSQVIRPLLPSENETNIESIDSTSSPCRSNHSRDMALVRRKPPSTSFFAIFYERPARRRYYRQISRSATNLTRRLSRSRLFLSSAQARNTIQTNNNNNNSNNSSSSDAHATSPDTIDVDNSAVEHDDVISVSESFHRVIVHAVSETNLSEQRPNGNSEGELDLPTLARRAETPPPPYTIS